MYLPSVSHSPSRRQTLNHMVSQRTFLVVLVCILTAYSLVEWFSTRQVLILCSANFPEDLGVNDGNISVPATQDGTLQSRSTVAKVTMSYGNTLPPIYQKILNAHQRHADKHGYPQYVLREKILPKSFSKQAHLLGIILAEVAKPEAERLEWLFWFDNDAVLMNENIPLEIFLPPRGTHLDVNLLVTQDHKGLNAGVFFIRVNTWAVEYLSSVLAMSTFKPDEQLRFGEQTAMYNLVLEHERYSNHTVFVPQRWFNAYRGNRDQYTEALVPHVKQKSNTIRSGDMMLHFAGTGAKAHLEKFVQMAEKKLPEWNVPLEQTRLEDETAGFWGKE